MPTMHSWRTDGICGCGRESASPVLRSAERRVREGQVYDFQEGRYGSRGRALQGDRRHGRLSPGGRSRPGGRRSLGVSERGSLDDDFRIRGGDGQYPRGVRPMASDRSGDWDEID